MRVHNQYHTVCVSQPISYGVCVCVSEYKWNDYAGLDVRGKIVIVLVNDPGFHHNDTTLFKGRELTYYGLFCIYHYDIVLILIIINKQQRCVCVCVIIFNILRVCVHMYVCNSM